jgi:hypothetical protein
LLSKNKLPLFDGPKCIGTRSASCVEVLYARQLVTLERNKKGYVVAAHCVHLSQTPTNETSRPAPLLAPVPPLRYSFRDAAIECRPWDLKRLNGARSGIHYAPASVLPDFTVVVSGCLHELKPNYLNNLRLLGRIFCNRMPEAPGTLALLLTYTPASNGHQPQSLILGRSDHQPLVQRAALFAHEQARKQADAESRMLRQVLDALLAAD